MLRGTAGTGCMMSGEGTVLVEVLCLSEANQEVDWRGKILIHSFLNSSLTGVF